MDAIQCIKTRRSIRRYMPSGISKEVLQDIVECANQAPSAKAAYPWHFVVVTEKTKLEQIADSATYGSFIRTAAACIIVCGDNRSEFTVIDCSAATQNILLAANAHGIGSCWVNAWKRQYTESIAKLINLPASLEMVSIISLGYPAENPQPQKKRLSEVLHWESF